MAEDSNTENDHNNQRITVEASSIEGIVTAIGMEIVEEDEEEPDEPAEPSEFPEELLPVLQTLADIYEGVEEATETDSRGRSRKMVRQYAGREDLDSNAVGHHLRVLEENGLVEQDGNRWRIAQDEDE